VNGIDALAETTGRPKELLICAQEESTDLTVRVEDSGVGLDGETVEKIFNPFFTTKAHGVGMGLSISRSIIESHGGHLWAVPRPSGGAIFQFTLPIRPKDADA
jgi:two-component system sensor kinase FixL